MSINPNDPVVAMLKDVFQEQERKMQEMAEAFQEALGMMAAGNAATFQVIFQRLVAVEQKLVIPLREDTVGKEL